MWNEAKNIIIYDLKDVYYIYKVIYIPVNNYFTMSTPLPIAYGYNIIDVEKWKQQILVARIIYYSSFPLVINY